MRSEKNAPVYEKEVKQPFKVNKPPNNCPPADRPQAISLYNIPFLIYIEIIRLHDASKQV